MLQIQESADCRVFCHSNDILFFFLSRNKFVVFHGIKPLVKAVRSCLVFLIVFDIFKDRHTVFFMETVNKYFAIFIHTLLIQGKQCNITVAGCFIYRKDRAFDGLVIVQCQCDGSAACAAVFAAACAVSAAILKIAHLQYLSYFV